MGVELKYSYQPEVFPTLCDRVEEFLGERGDKGLEVRVLQSCPHLLVTVALKRIEVHSQSP